MVVLCSGVLFLGLSGVSLAQSGPTGSIEGLVTDASGGVLPGVTVTVKNTATNVTRESVTEGNGRYRAAALQPGTYEVSATLSGFDVKPITGVEVQVGQTASVDLKMHPAGVTESVTVTGDTPIVDARRTDVSNVISQESLQNLPVTGRRWDNFVLLSPGVTNDGNFGLVSYRGISGLYNNNMVDGVDNNQAFFGEARGRTRIAYSVSESAIKEFQVGVSNMSAEFGRSAGGTVNAVTKSGTNIVTGETFYFLRSDKFMARNPKIVLPDPKAKPKEKRQQFGGGIGGPLKKDKIFFFADYDQQIRNFPVYTAPFSATFFSSACTAPAANCASALSFFQSLNVLSPRTGNNRVGLGKVDVTLNNANSLSLSVNSHRWHSENGVQTQPSITVAQSANGTDIVRTDFLVGNLNSVLSNRSLNEFRFQVGRDYEEQTPNGVPPSNSVTNGIGFGMSTSLPRPAYPHEQRYEFMDSISYNRGDHSFKTGVDLNFVKELLINLFNNGGSYAFGGLSQIANDCPIGATGCTPFDDGTLTGRHYNTFTQAFDLTGLNGKLAFNQWQNSFYGQDTWRLGNQIVLNLGIRYDYQQLPEPGSVKVDGVTFAGNPAYPHDHPLPPGQEQLGTAARRHLRPRQCSRHGDPRGLGRLLRQHQQHRHRQRAHGERGVTSVVLVHTEQRGLARLSGNVLFRAHDCRHQAEYRRAELKSAAANNPDGQSHIGSARDVRYHDLRVVPVQPRRTPADFPGHQFRARQFAGDLRVGWQHAGDVSALPRNGAARPQPESNLAARLVGDIALQRHGARGQKRYSKGFLFDANYTLSKSMDNGQESTTFFPQFAETYDPFSTTGPDGNAPSSFDRRHRFVGSAYYRPDYLHGVGISGVVTLESGLPINQNISGQLSSAVGAISTGTTNGTNGSFLPPWLGRNSERLPGRKTVDARVSKQFAVGGRKNVEILWEVFNVFNWINYTGASSTAFTVSSSTYDATANVATVTLAKSSGFLVPTTIGNTLFGMRDMQLGLKFTW